MMTGRSREKSAVQQSVGTTKSVARPVQDRLEQQAWNRQAQDRWVEYTAIALSDCRWSSPVSRNHTEIVDVNAEIAGTKPGVGAGSDHRPDSFLSNEGFWERAGETKSMSYPERMGPKLLRVVERQLLEDLKNYDVSGDSLQIEWWDACGEGHCTGVLGGKLESLSGLAVLDYEQNTVARGWMDFIHGGGNNLLNVFWLFLSVPDPEGASWRQVKEISGIPPHLWDRLPVSTHLLCAKTDEYDARWGKDPNVSA